MQNLAFGVEAIVVTRLDVAARVNEVVAAVPALAEEDQDAIGKLCRDRSADALHRFVEVLDVRAVRAVRGADQSVVFSQRRDA